jgi:hypothetical protein
MERNYKPVQVVHARFILARLGSVSRTGAHIGDVFMNWELFTRIAVANGIAFAFALIAASIGAAKAASLPLF